MTNFKKKISWFLVLAVAGASLIIINALKNNANSTVSSFGVGLLTVSIIKLTQFYRISRNPELMRKYEIAQKEERYVYIAQKSGYMTFVISIVAQFLGIFGMMLAGREVAAMWLATFMGLQSLVYIVSYYIFSKKY
ncbi:MAG: hypothetical protein WBH44_07205 [Proteocatella sp.]